MKLRRVVLALPLMIALWLIVPATVLADHCGTLSAEWAMNPLYEAGEVIQ